MSNQEDKIISLLKSAASKQKLSLEDKAQLKFTLMDVIKTGQYRTSMQKTPYHLTNRRFAMPLIPVLLAVLLVGVSGTAVVANDAKPGDPLYKLDQLVESIETKLVVDEEAKVKLMASLAQERVAELEAIQDSSAKVSASADAQAKFEARKAEAIARVAASIEKLNQLEAKFQARLDAETDTKARTRLQKIISHLQVVEDRREELIDKIEAREFGSANANVKAGENAEVKLRLRERLKLSDDDRLKIEDELRSEFRFKFEDEDDDDEDEDEDDDDSEIEVKLESNSGSDSSDSDDD